MCLSLDKFIASITISGMMGEKTRPIFLNLLQIRQPVPALSSIGHRISGVILFLLLPLSIYVLELSLESEQGFAQAVAICAALPMRLLAIAALVLFAHHLFNGIRFLLMDLEWGMEKHVAVKTAWSVIAADLLVFLITAGVLL